MKARVKDESVILSIGMIVKNEEDKLARCLDSLQPLLEGVSSELIITDTGSDDATVEIAKQYTDQVYHFDWIDDFSAARNFGLEKARGKWFLYVDADDQLKEPEELIRFLNNKRERDRYNTGLLLYYSPLDKTGTLTSELWVNRMFRMGMGNMFEGRIHEIPRAYRPFKYFKETFLHHDGYLYETQAEQQKKMERNNKLLELDLEEDPDNIRAIIHYAASCPDGKRLALLQHGRELIKKEPSHFFFAEMYWRLSRELIVQNKFEEIAPLYEEYRSLTNGEDHAGELELVLNLARVHIYAKDYKKAFEPFERYLHLYHEYHEGDLREKDSMSANSERCAPAFYNAALEKYAECCDIMGDYQKAFDLILQIDVKNAQSIKLPSDLGLALVHAEKLNRFDLLCKLDDWVHSQCTEINTTVYRNRLIRLLWTTFWTEGQLEKALSDTAELTGELPDLFRLLSPEADWNAFTEALQQDRKYMEPYQALLLCSAIRYHRDPSALLWAIGRESLTDAGNAIIGFTPAPELVEMLLAWEHMPVSNEVLLRGWIAELQTSAFAGCPEEKKLPLLHRMMEELSWYTVHLYHPDLLVPDEEKLLALPSPHRFGYWVGLALDAEKSGDVLKYIQYLRSAAESCPEMAQAVKMLIQEAQENDPEYQRKKEQEQLAQNIKGIIEKMILSGQTETAQSILSQYELIAPDDPDIPVLKSAIMQPPVLSEI